VSTEYESMQCHMCRFRDEQGRCREGPPTVVMIPGVPRGAIVPPGAQAISFNTTYPMVPPNHPACARIEKKAKVISGADSN
jgi:hypothetical protein